MSDGSGESSETESHPGSDEENVTEEWQRVLGSAGPAGHADFLAGLAGREAEDFRRVLGLSAGGGGPEGGGGWAAGPAPPPPPLPTMPEEEDDDDHSMDFHYPERESKGQSHSQPLGNSRKATMELPGLGGNNPSPPSQGKGDGHVSPLGKEALRQLELDYTDTEGEGYFRRFSGGGGGGGGGGHTRLAAARANSGSSLSYSATTSQQGEGSDFGSPGRSGQRTSPREWAKRGSSSLSSDDFDRNAADAIKAIAEVTNTTGTTSNDDYDFDEARDTFMAREASYLVPDFEPPRPPAAALSEGGGGGGPPSGGGGGGAGAAGLREDLEVLGRFLGGRGAAAGAAERVRGRAAAAVAAAAAAAPGPAVALGAAAPGDDGFIDLGTLGACPPAQEVAAAAAAGDRAEAKVELLQSDEEDGHEEERPRESSGGTADAEAETPGAKIGLDDLPSKIFPVGHHQTASNQQEERKTKSETKPGFSLRPVGPSGTEWAEDKWEGINQKYQEEQHSFPTLVDQELKSVADPHETQLAGSPRAGADPAAHPPTAAAAAAAAAVAAAAAAEEAEARLGRAGFLAEAPDTRAEFVAAMRSHMEQYASSSSVLQSSPPKSYEADEDSMVVNRSNNDRSSSPDRHSSGQYDNKRKEKEKESIIDDVGTEVKEENVAVVVDDEGDEEKNKDLQV